MLFWILLGVAFVAAELGITALLVFLSTHRGLALDEGVRGEGT
jgi:hypothetical protein